jgi:hypothetical protein
MALNFLRMPASSAVKLPWSETSSNGSYSLKKLKELYTFAVCLSQTSVWIFRLHTWEITTSILHLRAGYTEDIRRLSSISLVRVRINPKIWLSQNLNITPETRLEQSIKFHAFFTSIIFDG